MTRVPLGKVNEFPIDVLCPIEIDGYSVGVVNTGGSFFAFSNYCPHLGAELTGSQIYRRELQCWWHGSAFSLETGEVLSGPASDPLKTYRVEVQGENVFVLKE